MRTKGNLFKRFWPLVIFLFLMAGTAFTYAFWDSLNKSDTQDITIGEGVTLIVTCDVEPEGTLVPESAILKEGDVTEVEYTYTVSLDKEIIEPLSLTVICSEITIDGNENLGNLVNVSIEAPEEIQNTSVTVTVKVTLDEPDTEEDYNSVINQDISLKLEFTALNQEN